MSLCKCHRCGKDLPEANTHNASYIDVVELDQNDILCRYYWLICLECLKPEDKKIW